MHGTMGELFEAKQCGMVAVDDGNYLFSPEICAVHVHVVNHGRVRGGSI